jgi:hypothetical protein
MPNKMFTRVMFHATHADNIAGIFNIGLSPEFATGRRKAIWFTPKAGIQSGILHAANRHHWRIEDMHVVTVLVESDHIKYSGNGMLFYSEHVAIAESHAPATHFLDEGDEE